jgi:acyl-CoA thioesterase-1
VVNAGISGDTTAGGAERLPKLLGKYTPKIVVIELGGNDGLRGTSINSIESNLRSMIEAALDHDAKILLIGMQLPPNYGNAYTTSFQNLFPELASEYGIGLVERLIEKMMDEVWQQNLMQMDGIHPTAKGHIQIENIIWDSLQPLL